MPAPLFSVERPRSLALRIPKALQEKGVLPTRQEVLAEVLEVVSREAILCFQRLSASAFDITFHEGFEDEQEELGSTGISLKGFHLEFLEAAPKFTRVSVKNLPAEVPDEVLKQVLSSYGPVLRIENVLEEDIWNGDRMVQMTVNVDIPSLVRCGKYPFFVRYRGQRLCCHYCNRFGHMAKDCDFKKNGCCVRCGEKGHEARSCKRAWGTATPLAVAPAPIDAEEFPALPVSPVGQEAVNTASQSTPSLQKSASVSSTPDGNCEKVNDVPHVLDQGAPKRPHDQSEKEGQSKKIPPKESIFEGLISCSMSEVGTLSGRAKAPPPLLGNMFASLAENDGNGEGEVEVLQESMDLFPSESSSPQTPSPFKQVNEFIRGYVVKEKRTKRLNQPGKGSPAKKPSGIPRPGGPKKGLK